MEYEVLLTPRSVKNINKLSEQDKVRIKEKIRSLKRQPQRKGKQLTPTKYYRIRIGDYRTIYRIDEENSKVIILFIGHRSKVYYDFRKLI